MDQDALSKHLSSGKLSPVHSEQFSDCLYNFSKTPERIFEALRRSGFTLNYVVEDFTYLNINSLDRIAFPMICFCDILMEQHRILPHIKFYGGYGIGLSKHWGLRRGVQPVHYLIPNSPFSSDLKEAYRAADSVTNDCLSDDSSRILSDFILTTLAYVKPTYGKLSPDDERCFEDECEWRFMPSDLPDLPTAIPSPSESTLRNYRGTLWRPQTYPLKFALSDITDLIVPSEREVDSLLGLINELPSDSQEGAVEKERLKAKIRIVRC